jgi:hypothetical protein
LEFYSSYFPNIGMLIDNFPNIGISFLFHIYFIFLLTSYLILINIQFRKAAFFGLPGRLAGPLGMAIAYKIFNSKNSPNPGRSTINDKLFEDVGMEQGALFP